MSYLSKALDSRCSWALHRIAVIAGDDAAAQEHLMDAEFSAEGCGRMAHYAGLELPCLLADVPFLTREWEAGRKDAWELEEMENCAGCATGDPCHTHDR